MISKEHIIQQTKKWISDVVIGCNFCPFAANVFKNEKIFYRVEYINSINTCMDSFMQEAERLDNEPAIETSFLILPDAFQNFDDYLDAVALAEKLLKKNGYEGVYQVATFHPLYRFADASLADAANYTNRSPYPMLHLLREEGVTRALEYYKDPESIPERNIHFAREKGVDYMKMLWKACFE